MANKFPSCEDQGDEDNKAVPSEDESGILFYVNKDGFPISKKTWERMWRHVEKIHPKGAQVVQSVRESEQLAKARRQFDTCLRSYWEQKIINYENLMSKIYIISIYLHKTEI